MIPILHYVEARRQVLLYVLSPDAVAAEKTPKAAVSGIDRA